MAGETRMAEGEHRIMIEQSLVIDTSAGLLEITITGPAALAAEAKALLVRCVEAAQRVAHMERLH